MSSMWNQFQPGTPGNVYLMPYIGIDHKPLFPVPVGDGGFVVSRAFLSRRYLHRGEVAEFGGKRYAIVAVLPEGLRDGLPLFKLHVIPAADLPSDYADPHVFAAE